MKLSSYYNDLLLVENKKQAKQILSSLTSKVEGLNFNDLLNKIQKADPTDTNKYMGKIAKWFAIYIFDNRDNLNPNELDQYLDDINEHIDAYDYFSNMPNHPEDFKPLVDIYSKEWNDYETWKSSFLKFSNEYNKGRVNTREGKKGQQVLFEDNKVIVYKILSKQGMAYCGKDAPWCVTMPASSFYEHYTKGGNYFIIIRNKEIPITKEMLDVGHGDKGQIHRQFTLPNKEGYAMIALLIDSEFNIVAPEDSFTDYGNITKSIDDVDINKYNSELGYNLDDLLNSLGINDYKNINLEELITKNSKYFKVLISSNIDINDNLKVLAVKNNAYNIQYIKNPSEQVQLEAVSVTNDIIKLIENPTEQVKNISVKRNSYNIRFIKNPSEKLQIDAVSKTGDSIEYINNPSEEVQLAAVNESVFAIQYIDNPSEEVQLAAVTKNAKAIEYINNPSEKIQLAAVNENGKVIEYIRNPSEQVQLAAVNQKGKYIMYIDYPTEKVQLAAVKLDGISIRSLENPSENVQIEAVKQNRKAEIEIEYPTAFTVYYYKRKYKNKEPYDNELEKKYQHYINTGELLNEHYQRIKKLFI